MPDSSPQTSQPLLQEFLNLLREKKYSENSLQSHRLDLQKYLDWLGDGGEVRLEQLQVLKPADIQDYVEYLYQDYKPSTIARHLSSLKLFLNDLELSGKIRTNPVHRVRYPEVIADAPPPGSMSIAAQGKAGTVTLRLAAVTRFLRKSWSWPFSQRVRPSDR